MRKILSIGLAAGAAVAAVVGALLAARPEDASSLLVQVLAGLARRTPADVARDYGVMLLVVGMPAAVLGWGVWREARQRARRGGARCARR
jgi:hypothetical protein